MNFILTTGNVIRDGIMHEEVVAEDEIAERVHELLENMSPGDEFAVRLVQN